LLRLWQVKLKERRAKESKSGQGDERDRARRRAEVEEQESKISKKEMRGLTELTEVMSKRKMIG